MAKKRKFWNFYCTAAVYALVLLIALSFGLRYLWDFAQAYEDARPHHAIERYIAQLTPEYICGKSQDLIDSIDHNIQSEEDCRAAIISALGSEFSYTKRSAESTEEKTVYAIRHDDRIIGRVELTPQKEAVMGFAPWEVSADSYDLSYLITDTVSTTVPAEFPVYVNGNLLSDSYITETGLHYSAFATLYADYELPTLVSYTAGPCLGSIALTVADAAGNPVTIDENTDLNSFLDHCTQEEREQLESFIQTFVKYYVRFSGSSPNNYEDNYNILSQYLLKGSPLAKRVRSARDVLQYGRYQTDTITSLEINDCIRIAEDRILCDVVYVVHTVSRTDDVVNTFKVKLVLAQTKNGFEAEVLENY